MRVLRLVPWLWGCRVPSTENGVVVGIEIEVEEKYGWLLEKGVWGEGVGEVVVSARGKRTTGDAETDEHECEVEYECGFRLSDKGHMSRCDDVLGTSGWEGSGHEVARNSSRSASIQVHV